LVSTVVLHDRIDPHQGHRPQRDPVQPHPMRADLAVGGVHPDPLCLRQVDAELAGEFGRDRDRGRPGVHEEADGRAVDRTVREVVAALVGCDHDALAVVRIGPHRRAAHRERQAAAVDLHRRAGLVDRSHANAVPGAAHRDGVRASAVDDEHGLARREDAHHRDVGGACGRAEEGQEAGEESMGHGCLRVD